MLAAGSSNAAIDGRLHLSATSVDNRTSTVFAKLQVGGRTEAISAARDAGLWPGRMLAAPRWWRDSHFHFGNKRSVLKDAVDVAAVGDDEPVAMLDRPWLEEARAEPDPSGSSRCGRGTAAAS